MALLSLVWGTFSPAMTFLTSACNVERALCQEAADIKHRYDLAKMAQHGSVPERAHARLTDDTFPDTKSFRFSILGAAHHCHHIYKTYTYGTF